MIKPSTKEGFLAALHAGDIGLIRGSNLFATVQKWYAKKFKEGALTASHGFYIEKPPEIVEADGLYITRSAIIKDIGDSTKCWVFRYSKLTDGQLGAMNEGADIAVDSGGHYSIWGIGQFALRFFGVTKHIKDESGVFCTKLTGDLIVKAGVPYVAGKQTFEVDPSLQLNWFMSDEAKAAGWFLAASYDGAGNYFVDDGMR